MCWKGDGFEGVSSTDTFSSPAVGVVHLQTPGASLLAGATPWNNGCSYKKKEFPLSSSFHVPLLPFPISCLVT